MKQVLRYDRLGENQLGTFALAEDMQYQQQWIEGPSEASWVFPLPDSSGVRSWFANNWMNQIRVFADGGEVWRGWVWRMEASGRGSVYEASMDNVWNRVLVRFNNGDNGDYYPRAYFVKSNGDEDEDYTVPVWLRNLASEDTYGPLEHIGQTSTSSTYEADAFARSLIARHATPRDITSRSRTGTAENSLHVTCVGAMALANRILLPDEVMLHTWEEPDGPVGSTDDRRGGLRFAGDEYEGLEYGDTTFGGEVWTVAHEFRRIVRVVQEAWGGVLYPLEIQANNTPTAAGCTAITGAFDRLRELAAVPDKDGNQFVMQLTIDGGVSLRRLDSLPVTYYDYSTDKGMVYVNGTAPRWAARPGIVQDVGDHGYLPVRAYATESEALPELPPGQAYLERVDMAEGDEKASFSPRHITVSDTRRALDNHLRWMNMRSG